MKTILFVAGALFLFFQTQAQLQVKSGYTFYYDLGLDAYQSKEYVKADTLFSRALRTRPEADAYFNRAICRFNQGDKAGYCEDMHEASDMGDAEAKKFFYKNCVTIQTRYLDSLKQPSLENYWFTETKETYNYKPTVDYKLTDRKGEVVERYFINNEDTSYTASLSGDMVMPQFPGGEQARLNFMRNNIKYPVASRDNGIEGTVYVSFVVNSKGKLDNIKIMRSPPKGGELVEEALRILKLMPDWIPGTIDGKPAIVQFYMPLKFELR